MARHRISCWNPARPAGWTSRCGRFRGPKPPRFTTPFEALIDAIACQPLSLNIGILALKGLALRFGVQRAPWRPCGGLICLHLLLDGWARTEPDLADGHGRRGVTDGRNR